MPLTTAHVLTVAIDGIALRNFGAVVFAMNRLGYKPAKGGIMVQMAVRQLEMNLDKYGPGHSINDPESLGHAAMQFVSRNGRIEGLHVDLRPVMEAFVKDE